MMKMIFAALLISTTAAMAETAAVDRVTLACSGKFSIYGPDHTDAPVTSTVVVDFPKRTLEHSFMNAGPCTISDSSAKSISLQCPKIEWKMPRATLRVDGSLDRYTGQFQLWGWIDASHLAFILEATCSPAKPIF